MAEGVRLERPGAGVVVGVATFIVSVFGLIGVAMTFAVLGQPGGPPLDVPGQNLSVEMQLYATIGIYLFGLLVGVVLMRESPNGAYVLAAMMLGTIVLGFIVNPNIVGLVPSIIVYGLVLYIVATSKARPDMPTPALWVTVIATIFLSFLSMVLMGAAFGSFLLPTLSGEVSLVAPIAIAFVVLGLISWLIGAGVYKFRWTRATIGWPMLVAGVSAATTGIAFAAYGDDPAFQAQVGPEFEELIAMAQPTVGGAVAGVFTLLGLALVWMQGRREARQRAEDQSAIQEAFR